MAVYIMFLLIVTIIIWIFRKDVGDKLFFSIEFILITLIGMMSYNWNEYKSLWDIVSAVGGSTTIALSFLALLGYLDYINQYEDIKIFLKFKKGKNESEYEEKFTKKTLQRKECTRQEVQGVLGNLADIDRYKIKFTKSEEFYKRIKKVRDNESNQIIIDIEEDEVDQFYTVLGKEYKKDNRENKEKEPQVSFTKETQQQIDNIEKLLEELKTQK